MDYLYLSCISSHLNELSGYYFHHFSHLEVNIMVRSKKKDNEDNRSVITLQGMQPGPVLIDKSTVVFQRN